MADHKTSQEWDQVQEDALKKMRDRWLYRGEELLLPYGNLEVDSMLDEDQKKKPHFSDHGFDDYTLFYRKPEKYWNEVGLLVPNNINTIAPVKVHVFFMGGGFVSITMSSIGRSLSANMITVDW
jgi:hypothetical protein